MRRKSRRRRKRKRKQNFRTTHRAMGAKPTVEALHLGEGGKRGMEVEGEEEEAEGEGEWQRQSKAGPAAPGGSQIPI